MFIVLKSNVVSFQGGERQRESVCMNYSVKDIHPCTHSLILSLPLSVSLSTPSPHAHIYNMYTQPLSLCLHPTPSRTYIHHVHTTHTQLVSAQKGAHFYVDVNAEGSGSQASTLLRICSKDKLAEKAQDIQVTIQVKRSQETRYNLDPGSFIAICFWGRRPHGEAIDEALQIG